MKRLIQLFGNPLGIIGGGLTASLIIYSFFIPKPTGPVKTWVRDFATRQIHETIVSADREMVHTRYFVAGVAIAGWFMVGLCGDILSERKRKDQPIAWAFFFLGVGMYTLAVLVLRN